MTAARSSAHNCGVAYSCPASSGFSDMPWPRIVEGDQTKLVGEPAAELARPAQLALRPAMDEHNGTVLAGSPTPATCSLTPSSPAYVVRRVGSATTALPVDAHVLHRLPPSSEPPDTREARRSHASRASAPARNFAGVGTGGLHAVAVGPPRLGVPGGRGRAPALPETRSLAYMFDRCRSTVRTLRHSRSAIASFVRPADDQLEHLQLARAESSIPARAATAASRGTPAARTRTRPRGLVGRAGCGSPTPAATKLRVRDQRGEQPALLDRHDAVRRAHGRRASALSPAPPSSTTSICRAPRTAATAVSAEVE